MNAEELFLLFLQESIKNSHSLMSKVRLNGLAFLRVIDFTNIYVKSRFNLIPKK